MTKIWWFLNGAGGAFVLAVVIFALAVIGHVPLPLAAGMAGIMVAYGAILLLGRRWGPIDVLASPRQDERAVWLNTRAAAAAGGVIALVIVGGFFYDVARGAIDHSIWPPLGGVYGLSYLAALLIFARRS